MKGIPQGLCVSYILSSFYYANLEDAQLQFLRREEVGDAIDSASGAATANPERPAEAAMDEAAGA